jgi:hypothetical protein
VRISEDTRREVRARAGYACEYCSVSETDAGGELTIDHFQPRSQDGPDELENLIYACHRCNEYKADYWPIRTEDPSLWNPRREPADGHLLSLADGRLYPITETGDFTLRRLRLNRPALVALRLRRLREQEEGRWMARHRDLLHLLERLYEQQTLLLVEHRALMEKQRALLEHLTRSSDEDDETG